MKRPNLLVFSFITAVVAGTLSAPAFPQMSPEQARLVSARSVPVPNTVSSQMQKLIAAEHHTATAPESAAQWNALVDGAAAMDLARIAALRKQFDVKVEPVVIGNVRCFIVTPAAIPVENRHRLLVNVHGGAYVFAPGEAGTLEAIMMAGFSHMKVISIDYRMPPDFPYPAAMDDAMAVWRQAVKMQRPRNIGIFGTSTGGAMTIAMVQRAKEERLPLPGAIAPGTPWSDLSEVGDSYWTNKDIDNVLGAYEPLLKAAAELYANGRDLTDPHLSPVYGDFHGFPPTILTTGTRDLFLSNTIRVHRKLRQAGVVAQLEVYEGQSHAQYISDPTVPETIEAFGEITSFFDKHLGR
jgi:monoterpene epsilon-lactone hydrolase